MRVLVVEDDLSLGKSISKALQMEGFSVDWVRDGKAGELALESGSYAVMLLDLGLPRKDGMTLLKECRKKNNSIPVLIITARDAVIDRIAGLNGGADDYLVKPFHLMEVVARIRAVVRRHAGRADPELVCGMLRLNPVAHEVYFNDDPLVVSPREFALLHALMEVPGAVLSRSELEQRLYGWGEEVESNAVEVHIHHLRKKMGVGVIRNVRGVGYMIKSEA